MDNLNKLIENRGNNRDVNNQVQEIEVDLNNNMESKKDRMVRYTFYITYAFLMTTATVTFIEAIRTSDAKIRHILNLETCISVVAAFFYGVFMKKIKQDEINYKDINVNRYVDWSITTPIMLLVLLLAFCYNTKKSLPISTFLIVLVLNYGMLACGYVGETGIMDKLKSNIIGFVFFIAMYLFIFVKFIMGRNIFDNNILYIAFVGLWALYGVAYWQEEKEKNVSYNVLDLFSKCFVGIFFWAYFTKVFVLK